MSSGSAPKAFRKIDPNFEWVGWVASGVGFVIVIYYAVIMAWSFNYLWDSFSITAWAGEAGQHFETTLGLDKVKDEFDFGHLQWGILAGLLLTWVAIVASVWRGATTVSKVVYATVLIPWFILIVFAIRGVTLPGASEGLRVYLIPKFAKLWDPQVWLAAYTQVFFSLSIGFGIMIAYASFLPKKTSLVKNAVIICIADSVTAFVAGLAVYGCLGYLSHKSGTPISELPVKGLGLAYIAYPQLINLLPFGKTFFAVLFFLMILTLGIDSAFSLLESVASAVRDKWGMSHRKANLIVGGCGFILGIPLVTRAGLFWIDTMDYFMTFYGLAIVVLAECVVVASSFGAGKLRGYINGMSKMKVPIVWSVMIMFVVPLTLMFLVGAQTAGRAAEAYAKYPRSLEFLGGWLILILLPVIGLFLQSLPWVKKKEPESVIESYDGK